MSPPGKEFEWFDVKFIGQVLIEERRPAALFSDGSFVPGRKRNPSSDLRDGAAENFQAFFQHAV
jgi:hypothetical protein